MTLGQLIHLTALCDDMRTAAAVSVSSCSTASVLSRPLHRQVGTCPDAESPHFSGQFQMVLRSLLIEHSVR